MGTARQGVQELERASPCPGCSVSREQMEVGHRNTDAAREEPLLVLGAAGPRLRLTLPSGRYCIRSELSVISFLPSDHSFSLSQSITGLQALGQAFLCGKAIPHPYPLQWPSFQIGFFHHFLPHHSHLLTTPSLAVEQLWCLLTRS